MLKWTVVNKEEGRYLEDEEIEDTNQHIPPIARLDSTFFEDKQQISFSSGYSSNRSSVAKGRFIQTLEEDNFEEDKKYKEIGNSINGTSKNVWLNTKSPWSSTREGPVNLGNINENIYDEIKFEDYNADNEEISNDYCLPVYAQKTDQGGCFSDELNTTDDDDDSIITKYLLFLTNPKPQICGGRETAICEVDDVYNMEEKDIDKEIQQFSKILAVSKPLSTLSRALAKQTNIKLNHSRNTAEMSNTNGTIIETNNNSDKNCIDDNWELRSVKLSDSPHYKEITQPVKVSSEIFANYGDYSKLTSAWQEAKQHRNNTGNKEIPMKNNFDKTAYLNSHFTISHDFDKVIKCDKSFSSHLSTEQTQCATECYSKQYISYLNYLSLGYSNDKTHTDNICHKANTLISKSTGHKKRKTFNYKHFRPKKSNKQIIVTKRENNKQIVVCKSICFIFLLLFFICIILIFCFLIFKENKR